MSETISAADSEGILSRVRYQPAGFNPVEARIAAAVLEDPKRVAREPIVSLSRRISVSTGSIVRFAKLLGLEGYRDLKLALAADAAQERSTAVAQAGMSRYRACLDEQIRAIAHAAQEIDATVVDQAAYVLSRARRVDIAATGATNVVAQSLYFSLTLMGLHVRQLDDASEQAAAAAFLEEGDCLLAISVSGRTRQIVDAAARAAASGATVIAMTGSNRSPILKHANIQLVVDAQKGKFNAEWPLRTALVAVSRALLADLTHHMPQDQLNQRRSKWSSGRFGIRY
jgi:DNA-binding MurR/RpiR family transcriptional regulator